VSFSVDGIDQAFDLDGSAHVMIQPNQSLDFGRGDFSIETWVNFGILGLQVIFQKEVAYDRGTYLLEVDGGATSPQTTLRFLVIDATDVTNRNDLIVPVPYSTGEWHHVAAVRKGSTSTLYLDGQGIGFQTAGVGVDTGAGGAAAIGRKPSDAIRFLTGKVDELTLYSRALEPSEVEAIFVADAGKCK
jgi:hypothetical protein